MTDDTLTQEIQKLRKDIAKILTNQRNLAEHIEILARQIERIEGTIPGAFKSSAETWKIDDCPTK